MYYFYGNQKTGYWVGQDTKGIGHCFSPQELKKASAIIWVRTNDSGDFYWPHIPGESEDHPIPLTYEDSSDAEKSKHLTVGA